MERKDEAFDGAGFKRPCTREVASPCVENAPSANFSNGRISGRTSAMPVSSSGFDDDNLPTYDHGCTRQTERSMRASSSSSSQDDEMNVDDSSCNSGKAKKKKPKLDRSKLRKGKWTVRSRRDLKVFVFRGRFLILAKLTVTIDYFQLTRILPKTFHALGRRRGIHFSHHSLL